MNCFRELDCCHLEKHEEECWTCRVHGEFVDPHVDGCPDYETEGEYALRVAFQKQFDNIDRQIKEYAKWHDDWCDRCIRGGVRAAIVVLIAYAIFILWMVS